MASWLTPSWPGIERFFASKIAEESLSIGKGRSRSGSDTLEVIEEEARTNEEEARTGGTYK